jgi:hypothetical protein
VLAGLVAALVARYNVPDVYVQLVPGVISVGVAQSSDCARSVNELKMESKKKKSE